MATCLTFKTPPAAIIYAGIHQIFFWIYKIQFPLSVLEFYEACAHNRKWQMPDLSRSLKPVFSEFKTQLKIIKFENGRFKCWEEDEGIQVHWCRIRMEWWNKKYLDLHLPFSRSDLSPEIFCRPNLNLEISSRSNLNLEIFSRSNLNLEI